MFTPDTGTWSVGAVSVRCKQAHTLSPRSEKGDYRRAQLEGGGGGGGEREGEREGGREMGKRYREIEREIGRGREGEIDRLID